MASTGLAQHRRRAVRAACPNSSSIAKCSSIRACRRGSRADGRSRWHDCSHSRCSLFAWRGGGRQRRASTRARSSRSSAVPRAARHHARRVRAQRRDPLAGGAVQLRLAGDRRDHDRTVAVTKDGVLVISHDPYPAIPTSCAAPTAPWLRRQGTADPHADARRSSTRYDIGRVDPASGYAQAVSASSSPPTASAFPRSPRCSRWREPATPCASTSRPRSRPTQRPTMTPSIRRRPFAGASRVARDPRRDVGDLPRPVQSFDWRTLVEVEARIAPEIATACLTHRDRRATTRCSAVDGKPRPGTPASILREHGGSVPRSSRRPAARPGRCSGAISTPELVIATGAVRLGLNVLPWTVNDPADDGAARRLATSTASSPTIPIACRKVMAAKDPSLPRRISARLHEVDAHDLLTCRR